MIQAMGLKLRIVSAIQAQRRRWAKDQARHLVKGAANNQANGAAVQQETETNDSNKRHHAKVVAPPVWPGSLGHPRWKPTIERERNDDGPDQRGKRDGDEGKDNENGSERPPRVLCGITAGQVTISPAIAQRDDDFTSRAPSFDMPDSLADLAKR